MRLPVEWLKDFVPLRLKTSELADRLTMAGFEIEDILSVNGKDVLEVNVTPNRGDCLSVLGLSREVAALLGGRQRVPGPGKIRGRSQAKFPFEVKVEAKRGAPGYTLRLLDKVVVEESPAWLVDRLTQMGSRSINNVVDITNYLLLERGQPLHAFDLDKIEGGQIVVRYAKEGEVLLTLDGNEHKLTPEDLVIADGRRPIALAGIMGGKETEVDHNTVRVALESAFFDPATIRKTARRLGLNTDSSYRFERGIDPDQVSGVSERAVSLIGNLAQGELIGEGFDVWSQRFKPRNIVFTPQAVKRLIGVDWPPAEFKKIFQALGFKVLTGKKGWKVSVPPFRWDLTEETDLIEEVVRLKGINAVPTTFPELRQGSQELPPDYRVKKELKGLLQSLGLSETIHFSFMDPGDLQRFALVSQSLELSNPLGLEDSLLRPSLIPSLLKTVAFHQSHKITNARFYEWRRVFSRNQGEVDQPEKVAFVLSGEGLGSHWSQKGELDFYDIKGVVEKFVSYLGNHSCQFIPTEVPFLHPGKRAAVKVDNFMVGVVGEIHPDVAEHFALKKSTFVAELSWQEMWRFMPTRKQFRPYSHFPSVERDLAVLVDVPLSAGSFLEAIRQAGAPLLQQVSVFDVYSGPSLPTGKKSLGFSLRLGRNDRTLTDSEVADIYDKIVKTLKEQFQAEVR